MTINNDNALILDKYRVGKTTLKEFTDNNLTRNGSNNQAVFEKSHIKFKGGQSEDQLYDSLFVFQPPHGFTGDFRNAELNDVEHALLSEARFNFSDWQASRKDVIHEDEGITFLSEDLVVDNLSEKREILAQSKKNTSTPLQLALDAQCLRELCRTM